MSREELVIDSAMSHAEALAINPDFAAPEEIVKEMEVAVVLYRGFDGRTHQGQIVMNKKVIEDIKKFFDLALELNFPIEKVIPISASAYKWDDLRSCDDNNSSGFNYRLVGGTNRLSKHSLGCAFDINPVQNIYVRYDSDLKEIFRAPANGVYDPKVPGTLTRSHPLVELMKELEWEWGGDWTPETGREDYQHFEKNIS